MKAEGVEGFEKLKVSQNMFRLFLGNFYNAWDEETRKSIKPLSIKAAKGYLRFDFEIEGHKKWVHVTGPNTWY